VTPSSAAIDPEVVPLLERKLVRERVVDDDPDLRIAAASAEIGDGPSLEVRVTWSLLGRTGNFDRMFDPVDVQMLTDPTAEETALAFANWVRWELDEHVSELIAAGEFRD
jgi:hypothetical protein